MNDILKKLEGGDRRSIGRVSEVVADVFNDPSSFEMVFNAMLSDDPIIRMRSADAVEKITAKHPEYLQPYKEELIQQVARIDQQKVRWHVAQMFPRLELGKFVCSGFFAYSLANGRAKIVAGSVAGNVQTKFCS